MSIVRTPIDLASTLDDFPWQVREVTDVLAANGATMILIATDKPQEPKPEAK